MEKINYPNCNLQHKISDFVMYRQNGICQIVDIRKENFCSGDEKFYYILKSVYEDKTIIYVPVDSKDLDLHMRHILAVEEIELIIEKSEESQNEWVDDGKLRLERFEQILHNSNRAEILWLVKVLSIHKIEDEKQNKKFYASDEKILAAAEKIIIGEFAFILGIEKREVIPYIMKHIKKKQM